MFGDITLLPVPKPVVTMTPVVTPTTPTTPTKPTIWDTINNLLDTGNKAVDIVQNVKGGSSGGGGYTSPTLPTTVIPGTDPNAPTPAGGSSLKTVALVGGGLAAAGTIAYFIFKKKKK